jgi:GT2 family glycosyltransferase
MIDISVIIVSWKVREKLRANLLSLRTALRDLKAEILLVDNNSEDGTLEMLAEEFPEITVIANQYNFGFARANNQAMAVAQGHFILLLNPDMRVFPDTIAKALVWAENNSQATVSGCRLENDEGNLLPHVRRFPRLSDQLAIILKLPHLLPSCLDTYLQTDFDYHQAAKVDSIRGAFFLINREAWRHLSGASAPFLDERYFIWFEEVDFCRQVYKNGGEVWYMPEAACVDYVGQSFSQVKLGLKQKYFQDSMLKYFQKWEPYYQSVILKIAWFFSRAILKLFS